MKEEKGDMSHSPLLEMLLFFINWIKKLMKDSFLHFNPGNYFYIYYRLKKLFQGFEMCSYEIEDQELSLLINCSQITLMYLSISINTVHITSNKEIHFKVL